MTEFSDSRSSDGMAAQFTDTSLPLRPMPRGWHGRQAPCRCLSRQAQDTCRSVGNDFDQFFQFFGRRGLTDNDVVYWVIDTISTHQNSDKYNGVKILPDDSEVAPDLSNFVPANADSRVARMLTRHKDRLRSFGSKVAAVVGIGKKKINKISILHIF